MLGHPMLKTYDKNRTHVIVPPDSCLELRQAEMYLDAEDDRPVLLPTLACHGLGTRSQ